MYRDERTDYWRRRTGTRPGLENRAKPPRRAGLRRPGQRRHRPGRRKRRDRRHRLPGPDRVCQAERRRPDRRRARGPAGRRHRRRLRAGGPSRSSAPRKAAAELEASKVFCKDLLRNGRCAHGRLPDVPRRRRALQFLARARGRADGGQGRRAGRRQGRDRLRQPRRGRRRGRADRPAAGLRRRGRPAGDRGTARRPGGQRAGDHRRPDDRHAPAGPGPQAGLRRRHRPEHRRHGRLLPCPAGRRRRCCTGSRSTSSCRRSTR